MAAGKSDEIELEDGFEENGDTDSEEVAKANAVKNSLTKRRVIDELLEERRLQRRLRDYDFDLDDDDK
ncbi:MAG: PA3496 family putative envelope integrity protein [Gammaproteobacteria bacterium]